MERSIERFVPTLARTSSLLQIGSEVITSNEPCPTMAIEEVVNRALQIKDALRWGLIFLKASTGAGKSLCVLPAMCLSCPGSKVLVAEPQIEIAKNVAFGISAVFSKDFQLDETSALKHRIRPKFLLPAKAVLPLPRRRLLN